MDRMTQWRALGLTPEDFVPACASTQTEATPAPVRRGVRPALIRRTLPALLLLAALVILAFVGGQLVPYGFDRTDKAAPNLAWMEYSPRELERLAAGEAVFPHLLGTDALGRDQLARLLAATRLSLGMGLSAALTVLLLGTAYGAAAGWLGGRRGGLMMALADLLYAVPDVLVVLVLAAFFKPALAALAQRVPSGGLLSGLDPSVLAVLSAFCLIYWVGMSRVVRAEVLRLKEQDFVLAARALGVPSGRILLRHILPNCAGQLCVTACLYIPSAIFLESSLSFLGLGVSAPRASLGTLIADAVSGIYSYPARLSAPVAVLVVMILAFHLLGDALRDVLDPRAGGGEGN